MGPILLARLLQLNETQEGVLSIAFQHADDNGLLLLDLKDLQSLMQYVGTNADEMTLKYGNVSTASVGAIQRGLRSSTSRARRVYGEPAVKLDDFMQTMGAKACSLLSADELITRKAVSTSCSGCCPSFSNRSRSRRPRKTKLVFFFDEAHLLFSTLRRR